MNSRQMRKRILIAESEIDRALLLQQAKKIIADMNQRAAVGGGLASAAAMLEAGFALFRGGGMLARKRSWISAAFDGARLGTSLWKAVTRRSN
jgi:hypothetical protein